MQSGQGGHKQPAARRTDATRTVRVRSAVSGRFAKQTASSRGGPRTRAAWTCPPRAPKAPACPPENHQRQRESVQRIAERLFATRGFRDASIRVLAARCRCSVGHLYNLYGSKLGLYRVILATRVQELAEVLVDVLSLEKPVPDRLGGLLKRTLGFFEENSAFFRIYIVETGGGLWKSKHPVVTQVMQWQEEYLRLVAELLKEGQERGEIRRDIATREAAVSFFGVIRAHVLDWIWKGEKGSLVDRAEEILNLYLGGLRAPGGNL